MNQLLDSDSRMERARGVEPLALDEPEPVGWRRERSRPFFGCRPPVVEMTRLAHERLRRTVGALPAERGGIFVSRRGAWFVEDFLFDDASDKAQAVYYPNADYLNARLERDYEPRGFRFVGVGHSHPAGFWRPSGDANWGDVKAARSNLLSADNAHLDAIFIPIIESEAVTGHFRLHAFVMLREDLQVHAARVEIVD